MNVGTYIRKKRKNPRDFAIFGHPSQPDIGRVCEWHQHGHAVTSKAQKIEFFESGTEGASADVFYGSNPLIRIDDFVTDLKGHTGPPQPPLISKHLYFETPLKSVVAGRAQRLLNSTLANLACQGATYEKRQLAGVFATSAKSSTASIDFPQRSKIHHAFVTSRDLNIWP